MEALNGVFDWLIRASWQASVLVAIVLFTQWLFRKWLSPGWRYALWLLVLARLVMPVSPQSPLSLFNISKISLRSPDSRTIQQFDNSTAPRSSLGLAEQAKGELPAPGAPAPAIPSNISDSREASPEALAHVRRSTFRMLQAWLPLVWLSGVCLLALRMVWQNTRFARRVLKQRQVTNSAALDVLEDCKQAMNVRTPLTIIETQEVKSPALYGFVRPRLVLPQGMLGSFTTEELGYIFLHELAHVKRCDMAVNWLVSGLRALHWFNPILWFAFRRMAADREVATDALALSRAPQADQQSYGQAIIKLLESFTPPAPVAGLVGILEDKQEMKRRIAMIAEFTNTPQWPWLAPTLAVALAAVGLTNGQTTPESRPGPEGNLVQPAAERKRDAFSMRKLELPEAFHSHHGGSVSPDGRFVSTGRLIVDLSTGAEISLPDSKAILGARFSPDGKQIAVGGRSTNNPFHVNEVYVIDVEKRQSRRIYRNEQVSNLEAMDWSPDGREVLFIYMKLGQTRQLDIATISVQDGTVRVLKSLDNLYRLSSFAVNYSPDGQWIAFDKSTTPSEDGPRDLFLLKSDESREVHLVQHPADDYLLGWAPFRDRILFGSNRRGTWDAFTLHVVDGAALGEPELVREGFGRPRPFGFTKSGSFMFRLGTDISDVYLADLDPISGKVQGKPSKLPHRYEGRSRIPAWSPIGRSLAFVSTHGQRSSDEGQIWIRQVATGEEKPFQSEMPPITWPPMWSPDGRALLCLLRPFDKQRLHFAKLDVQAGAVSVLPETKHRPNYLAGWAPDGRSFYFAAATQPRQVDQVIRCEIDSGIETAIPLGTTRAWGATLSRDGRQIAFWDRFFYEPGPDNQPKSLMIISAEGGTPRELVEQKRGCYFSDGLAWSPDDRYVYFCGYTYEPRGESHPYALWRVAANGGEPENLGVIGPSRGDTWQLDVGHLALAVSHDGRQAAFTISIRDRAIWLMENFLPKANALAK